MCLRLHSNPAKSESNTMSDLSPWLKAIAILFVFNGFCLKLGLQKGSWPDSNHDAMVNAVKTPRKPYNYIL